MPIIIERKLKTAPDSAYSVIATLPLTDVSYPDTGLLPETEYEYRFKREVEGKVYEQVAFSASTVPGNNAPVITLAGENPVVLVAGQSYTEPGYTITDAEEGTRTNGATITGTINNQVPGLYELLYNYSDAAGAAAAEVSRVVQVTPAPSPLNAFTATTISPSEIQLDYTF